MQAHLSRTCPSPKQRIGWEWISSSCHSSSETRMSFFCHVLFFLCWNCLSLFCSWFVVYNKKNHFFTFPLSNLVSISLSFQNELSKFPSADNIFNYEEFSEICFVILSFKITYFHIRFVYDLFQTFGSLPHAVHWEHKILDSNLTFSKCFAT